MRAVVPLLLLLPASRGAAQTLQVTGIRGVAFGPMLPGTSAVVSRTDGSRSAQFDIKGTGSGRVVQLQFTLPAALSGPGGAVVPLSYASADAGFSALQSIASQTAFDPRSPYTATLATNGRGSVFLGCTAQPAAGQAPGNYTATLTLTVTYFP